jgi:ABC-type lipoprotein export system ATPase subunit
MGPAAEPGGAAAPSSIASAAIPLLEGRGLYHIYREREIETVALRGVDLILERGVWTSVMGPSGSGKSTLMHVLAGLQEPTGGSVLFWGHDVTRLPAAQRAMVRRRSIGVVLQRDNLHTLLDVADNVALPLRLDGRNPRHIVGRVSELLKQVGLSARGHHYPRQLSGGELQRAAIAVALAPAPPVLVADELTGELDLKTAAAVLDVLAQLRDREALAILTVTHSLKVAERADRRLVMRDGSLTDA